jgi:SWI/SNF-related matrix-associated actin-dependent regulator of chromatin subfamily A3
LNYKPFDNQKWYNVVLRNPIQRKDKQGFERLKILMQSLCIRRTKQMQSDGKPLIDMPPCQVYEYKIPWSNDHERNLYKKVERYSRQLFRRLVAQDELVIIIKSNRMMFYYIY